MPIPSDISRVSLLGTLSGGEIFDTSFWCSGSAPTSPTLANAFAAEIATLLNGSAALTAMKALIESDCVYQQVKVYGYPSGGPSAESIGVAAITGGTGTGSTPHPLQTCLVATLHTNFAGRRFRGRMYFPANGAAFANPYFSSTVSANLSSGLAAFFTAINANGVVPTTVVVLSQMATVDHVVTAVSTDTKPDIQRRRANRLSGQITTSTAVT